MIMKKILITICIFLMVNNVHSQNSNEEIESFLRDFYISYNNAHIKCRDEIRDGIDGAFKTLMNTLDSLHQTYCTKHLINKMFDNGYDEGYDILMWMSSDNIETIKSMSITQDSSQKNMYHISYNAEYYYDPTIKKYMEVKFRVVVIEEDGVFKIDDVFDYQF